MVDNAAFPKQSLFEKKGKGVFRRFFHFMPVRGPTAINRRIQHCNTVTGSKPHRAFVDIGVPGKVWMARRSCHQCDGCLQMDYSKCENKKYQLTEKGAEDPGGYVDLVPKKGGPGRAVARGYLRTIGRSIADDLGTGHQGGVVVVVEMSAESEAWAICVTEGEVERVTESDAHEYPCFEPGDVVIRLKKIRTHFPRFVVLRSHIKDDSRRRRRSPCGFVGCAFFCCGEAGGEGPARAGPRCETSYLAPHPEHRGVKMYGAT